MHRMKRFFETSIIYMLGIILSKIITFFLLPIYTSYLSPSEFGYYDLVLSVLNFLVPILYFQIWDGLFRFSFDFEEIESKYKVVNNTYFIFSIGIFFYVVIMIVLNQTLEIQYFIYIFIYGISFAINYLYSFIARTFLRNKLFVISGLFNTVITAVLNILLIIQFELGVESLLIAASVGFLLQAFIIEMRLQTLKRIKLSDLDLRLAKDMLRFSLPLCISTVSYWLLTGFTKVNINYQLGLFDNGIYSVADRFSGLIALGISIFQFSWNELAYSMSGESDRKKNYEQMLNTILKFTIFGSSILLLIIKLIFPYLIATEYKFASVIIPITLFGVASNSIGGFVGTIFSSEKNTKWILWSTLYSSLTNIILSVILTPKFGLIGASIALMISFISLTIVRVVILGGKFDIKIEYKQLFYIMLYILTTVLYFYANLYMTLLLLLLLFLLMMYSFRKLIIASLFMICKK